MRSTRYQSSVKKKQESLAEEKQDSLPSDLNPTILLFLSDKEIFTSAMLVSKAWSLMANDAFVELKNNSDNSVIQNRLQDIFVHVIRKKHPHAVQKLIMMGANVNDVYTEKKYELALMPLPNPMTGYVHAGQIKKGTLYLTQNNSQLVYTAMTPHSDTVPQWNTPLSTNIPVPNPLTLEALNESKEQILNEVSKHDHMKIAMLNMAATQGTSPGDQKDVEIVLLLLRSKANVTYDDFPNYTTPGRSYRTWTGGRAVECIPGYFKQTEENKQEPLPKVYYWMSILTLMNTAILEKELKENNTEDILHALRNINRANPLFTRDYLRSFISTPADVSLLGVREELTQADRNRLTTLPELKSLRCQHTMAAIYHPFKGTAPYLIEICFYSIGSALLNYFVFQPLLDTAWPTSTKARLENTIINGVSTPTLIVPIKFDMTASIMLAFLLLTLKLVLTTCKNKAVSAYKYLRNQPRETYLKPHQLHFPLRPLAPSPLVEFKNVPTVGLLFKPAPKDPAAPKQQSNAQQTKHPQTAPRRRHLI